jgi:hypothetical protein
MGLCGHLIEAGGQWTDHASLGLSGALDQGLDIGSTRCLSLCRRTYLMKTRLQTKPPAPPRLLFSLGHTNQTTQPPSWDQTLWWKALGIAIGRDSTFRLSSARTVPLAHAQR